MNYKKIYNSLIQKRLVNRIDRSICYCEYHHIKMRALYPELENDSNNIVALTAREHFIAHRLLAKWYQSEYGNNDRHYNAAVAAVWKLAICKNVKITARTYEKIKLEFSKTHSVDMSGCNNPMYGKNSEDFMSKEAIAQKRAKQKANAKGGENIRKISSDPVKGKQWRDKLRKSRIGIKLSEDHKKNIGKASIGKHWWNNGTIEVFQFNCPTGFISGRLPFSAEMCLKLKLNASKSKEGILNVKKNEPKRFADWHKKSANKLKGNHWWTNGIIEIYSKTCPDSNFKLGRLPQK